MAKKQNYIWKNDRNFANDVFFELFAFKMIHYSVLSVFFLNFTLK